MFGTKILLLFIIFMIFGGTDGTGEENENDLFGRMWRKALASDSNNLTKLNFDRKKEEKPKEVKIENEEDDDQKMGESENKFRGKIKMEPIFDQTDGKDSDQKNYQKIKKEAKIEENTLEDLKKKWHKESDQNDASSAQSELNESADQDNKGEKKKLALINKFEKMRKEYKLKKNYKNENRNKIEIEIAKELGIYRNKIYKWKRELCWENKKPSTADSVKRSLIKKFDKMRKEYQMRSHIKREQRNRIENGIAKALGIYRNKIYKWKRELRQQMEQEERKGIANEFWALPTRSYTKARKREIVEHFDKLVEEFADKFNVKMSNKIKEKIARKFGVCLRSIYRWKNFFEIFANKF